jgi:hypothetical protein
VHARIAAFEGGDVERLREMNQQRLESGTESFPDGMRRVLVLGDRSGNRRLFVTLFDSADAVTAAEGRFEQMGDEIPQDVRGRRTSVEVYEVGMDHDPGDAAAARVSTLEGSPDQVEEGARYGEESVLPRARELPGWKGVLTLANRETGRVKLITFWESADAMEASEEPAGTLREDSARASGARIGSVERNDVLMNRSL